MTIGPSGFSGKRKLIVSSQETFLSIYTARNSRTRRSPGAGSSQGENNSDSVSLSDEALQAARLRDEDRLKEKQTNRKQINTDRPGAGIKSPPNLTGGAGNDTLSGGNG
ncbi:MAG: hypothetical protein EBR67_10380, partial [Proteobacteria bacterium]|nr:hypothetical protein [Pseudomonadota bacterium]